MESIIDFSKDQSGSASTRLIEAKSAMEVIIENLLVGVGIGQQALALNAKGLFWRGVHNVYLQIAAEIGIPAMVVFILLLIRLLKSMRQIQIRARKRGGNQDVAMLAIGSEISLVAFCVGALFHPVAYHFFFYYTAGFAVALKTIANQIDGVAKIEMPARYKGLLKT
jgi:O-antigen ligase